MVWFGMVWYRVTGRWGRGWRPPSQGVPCFRLGWKRGDHRWRVSAGEDRVEKIPHIREITDLPWTIYCTVGPNLPLPDVAQDLCSTDPTQETCSRLCIFYDSLPATWARSYFEVWIRDISALKYVDHEHVSDLCDFRNIHHPFPRNSLRQQKRCSERLLWLTQRDYFTSIHLRGIVVPNQIPVGMLAEYFKSARRQRPQNPGLVS